MTMTVFPASTSRWSTRISLCTSAMWSPVVGSSRIYTVLPVSRRDTGRTVYILDEPTTGLHFADIHKLIQVLQRLAQAGNTVIVIEHNLDVIKWADHVIDLGPEGGAGGGRVVCTGTPEECAQCAESATGRFLRPVLERGRTE